MGADRGMSHAEFPTVPVTEVSVSSAGFSASMSLAILVGLGGGWTGCTAGAPASGGPDGGAKSGSDAGNPGHDEKPRVAWVAPAEGASIGGTVALKASATDDVGVVKVQFFVDSGLVGEATAAPFSLAWDSTAFPDGAHMIKALAYDTANQTASAERHVNVDNTPPSIHLTSPEGGSVVSTLPLVVTADATDAGGIDHVAFTLDGNDAGSASRSPFTTSIADLASGNHALVATAFDQAGNSTPSEAVTFTLDLPPTVTLTAPEADATVSGTVTLSATASDDVGVASVRFMVAGATLATVTSPPYTANWDTCAGADGTVAITVEATDTRGQKTTDTRTVTVANASAPPVLAGSPGDGTATLTWTTSCGGAIASSNLYWASAPGVTTSSTVITGVTSPYVHSGLTNCQKYYYRVAAVNGATVGSLSNELAVKPNVNGSPWCNVASGTTYGLSAVWGSGPNDVWAVGSNQSVSYSGLSLHWNGSAWSSAMSPTTRTEWLYGVWGSGPNDVWAVGQNSGEVGVNGPMLRWNGSAWSDVPIGGRGSFHDIWGSGPTDVWALGDAGIFHWNGNAWSSVASGTTNYLYGVWGSGPNDVWAVGYNASGLGAIFHWNGSVWSSAPSPTTERLSSVWGSGSNDVWAVGESGTILHWDGSAWSHMMSGTTTYLLGVWGSGASDVWTIGETILHWNGSEWASVASGTTNMLRGIWGSGPGDVWAVGDSGTILHYQP